MAFKLKLLKRALIYIFNQFFSFTSYRDINDYFIINSNLTTIKKYIKRIINLRFLLFLLLFPS